MPQTIEVDISPTGEVKVESKGYEGKSCTEATKFIEEALGKSSRDTKTADYAKQPKIHQQLGN